MTQSEPRRVEHVKDVQAPAKDVYNLLADVENWPRLFPPTLHVDLLQREEGRERLRIWATANGTVKNWTSRRVLDPEGLRIDFRQEVSAPPIAEMGGAWVIEERPEGGSRVRLLHDYRAIDPSELEWIDGAVDRNSRSELDALKANIERVHSARELTFSFEDTIRVEGSVKDTYDFVNDAGLWPERLPHVAAARFETDDAGVQTLEMDTRSQDGTVHTTKSHRIAFPHDRIVYKQSTLPALMDLHTGRWTFEEEGTEVLATSQHTVVINADNVTAVLGEGATIADARKYVREALSANSGATLRLAKAHAENGR